MKRHPSLLLALSLVCASLLHAETETAPIPFSEIGAKATADYRGDAIGITCTSEGARLHTGFQKLAGNVSSEGLTLESTGEDGGSLKLTATSIGRDPVGAPTSATALPSLGKVSVEEKHVCWVRPGLVEEYSVSADGVRQDFIVAVSPVGTGELSVELALKGARAEAQGDGARLTLDASGRELIYARLRVEDATGRKLDARLEVLAADRLAVRVDDADAVYPVRIDPTFSDADWISLNPGIRGTNSQVSAMAVDATDNLYIGGGFTIAGGITANRIAKWDGNSWTTLGGGLNGAVFALAISGTDLYVGGNFTTAGGGAANYIAKWNGSAWSALGSGTNTVVASLAISGTDLYVGGNFTIAGGTTVNHVAKWNGSTWSGLGTGMTGSGTVSVYALAVKGSELFAGGAFTAAGGVPASHIAKWNGSSWSALGSGMNNYVKSIGVSGSIVYAGGIFTTAGGISANRIAAWNGTTWSALGLGTNGSVQAIAFSGTDLYAGGQFFTAGGSSAVYIAKWNGSAWSPLGSGVNSEVQALASSGSNLFVGGIFEVAGSGVGANRVAKWNGSSWSALGIGMDKGVSALAVSGTDLYVGGYFYTAGGVAASRIAKWDGTTWSALGTGMNQNVRALAVDGTNVYAGGDFDTAGGISANYVAKWNGSAWQSLGSGVNSAVNALVVKSGILYAGGYFTTAGGSTANRIAFWNGSNWSALGSGMNNPVNALAFVGSNLYAGGEFTVAGGVSASRIAKWNGGTWSAMGTGVTSDVLALAAIGNDLYAGGNFTTAGGIAVNRIAKWNGSAWSALGAGLPGSVTALAVNGSDLYVGGGFTELGGGPGNGIAKWDGSNWSALGSGMNGSASALAVDSSDYLYLGGNFTTVGTTFSPFIAGANLNNEPPPAPDIAVSGNGIDITNGDVVPQFADFTDFGTTALESNGLTHTFTIANVGTAPLTFTGVAPNYITLSGSPSFTVTSQPATGTIGAAGGNTTFVISLNPTTSGVVSATISIATNDPDETPFTFVVRGKGASAAAAFADVIAADSMLTDDDALPDAIPFGDGVENLLKYAFNMNLSGPDVSGLVPGTGNSGLPSTTTTGTGSSGVLCVEFVRRVGSGLVYTPKKSTTLAAGSFLPFSDTPTVDPIGTDGLWERVTYDEPVNLDTTPACFGVVEVTLP